MEGRLIEIEVIELLDHILNKYSLINSQRIRLHVNVLSSGMNHHKAKSEP